MILAQPAFLRINVTQGGGYIAVYVDLNDNCVFEPNETLTNGPDNGNPGKSVGLSGGILTEVKGCHKVRIIYSDDPITGPCDDIASGEIEDYVICWPEMIKGGGDGKGKVRLAQTDLPNDLQTTIYPQPASDFATLQFDVAQEETLSISIVNLQGKAVQQVAKDEQFSTGTQSLQLDLSNLTPGIYFVKINSRSAHSSTKLIVF